MVDINKCDPCLETDICCNLICKKLSNQACQEAGGTWNKELGECCFKTREESKYEPDINSDNSITLNLKLGLSNLFPGLDCDSNNCPVDLRLLNGLTNDKGQSIRDKLSDYYIRIEGKTKCGAIEGFEYTPATLESPAKFTSSTLEFPIDIGLDTLHLEYLKPLIEVTQDYQNADNAEKPNIIKNFDPSCLLNEQWITNNANANFISYGIKSIYFNNLTRSVPLVIYNFLDNDRDAISRDLSKFRTYKVKDDGSVVFLSVRSLKDLLNPATIDQNILDAMQFAWDGIERPEIVPPELKEAIQAIKNGPNSRQKAELKNARDVVVTFRKYLDNIAAALWDPNRTNTDRLSPADRRAWLAFQYLKDCINVPLDAPNPSNGVIQFNNRDKVREILADIFVLGKLCPANKNKDLCELLDCLGKKNTVKDGNPTGQFELTNLKAAIYRRGSAGGTLLSQLNVPLYQKCYGDLNVKIIGGYVGNALKVTFIIGEDACDSTGELPLRKTNYAVLKRPLEFIFTNNNNCEPSNLINSCKANCCTTYDDSKKLLDATGINDEDFQDGLVYSKLDKEDDKFIGYTVYKCKTCDEITETEINSFCEFETQGFCCSEGYWEQVNGLEKLKKPVTAGITDIFKCCQVAKNEFNKNSHFIFSTFKNSATNTDNRIIVDKNRSGLQLLKSDLENNCLPKTKCCIAKREGGACFYRKPRSSDRRLEYDISFEVSLLTLSEDHEGRCEKLEEKDLGDRRKKSNGIWDSVVAFNDDLTPNFKGIISPNSSNDFFSDVLPGCDPFDTLKVRLSQSKSLPQDEQAIEFIRILLELKKLNRWVFNRDDQKNQKIIDIWDKELKDNLKINVVDIASNDDNKIKSIINSITYGNLKPYNKLYIKQFSTQSEFNDDDQWIPYNFNGQQYSCNAYRSCLDFLKLEKKIFVYSDTVNYCNLLDNGSLTNDMDRLVAYLIDSSGTRFKSIISGALNKYAMENKIEFVPGKCTNTETLYGCISSSATIQSAENCCPTNSSISASHGSYFALGGNKTLLDDPPHPVGTYSDGNNPYNPQLLTQLKKAVVDDMFEDFNKQSTKGDGSGTYKITLNIKNVNPCLEYDIEGTFKDYEGNIIDSELKCKNHAQHILECCDTIEISGGTCTCETTPQTFDDYVYIPGLAALSQATVQLKTASCNMTADIKDTSSGNRVFIFSTNNPNPVLTNFGDKEILVVISAEYGDIPKLYNIPQKTPLTEQKFRIKANELLTGLTTNNDKFSARLKNIIFKYLNNLKTNNPKLPDPTDGMLTRTVWKLYLRSNEIEVQSCPTDGCLELSAVQYKQKGDQAWVPSEYICIDNIPYPPHIDGIDARYRIPGTKYYNGRVVTDCNACDDNPVSSPPPPQGPSGPTDPSDPESVPPGCENIKKEVDAKKSQIISILIQLKDKLLTYNEQVSVWNNNNCSIKPTQQQCNNAKKRIEYNYIDADKRLLNRLNAEDITPGKETITESALPLHIKVTTPSQATLDQKKKYTKLLEELEKLENDLRNCN